MRRAWIKVLMVFAALSFRMPVVLHAQESMTMVQDKATQVSIDPFGNLYLISVDREFRKYSRLGQLEATHTDLQLSELSEIMSDHPFKCMVYYPEFRLIRVFGNKLQVLAELDLTLFGFGQIACAAPSTGYQSFWLFDATSQKIVRINQQYEIVDQGSDLIPILGGPIFPEEIKEREGWLYAYDPERGLYIFDNFGAFSKKLNVTGAGIFSVVGDRIFFIQEGQIFEIDPLTQEKKLMDIKVEGKILAVAFRQIAVQRREMIDVIRF